MEITPLRLRDLAERLGCAFEGDGDFVVRGVASLESAGPQDLSFIRSARMLQRAAATRAGALIAPLDVELGARPILRSSHPELHFARAVAAIVSSARPQSGVHPTAVIAASTQIDSSASVGPHCIIGARCSVGARSVLYPRAVLYDDVRVGVDCVLHAGVVVREESSLGDRVILQPGAVIGADGFGYAFDEEGMPEKRPQVGRVVIENDVEIGALATVDRAALGETRIRRGAKIDNLCLIAHNCDIGEGVIIAGLSGLSGSVTVERGAILMGQVGVADHARIGERAFLAARAGVLRSGVPARAKVFGLPPREGRLWHRIQQLSARLPELFARVRALERQLGTAHKADDS